MTRQEHLLVILAEECAEIQHCISKTLRFGPDEVWPKLDVTNFERLEAEFNDLLAVVSMLDDEGIQIRFDQDRQKAKTEKVKKYMKYSQSLGLLE
jgi:NTP pyrophosphatase (non-canonical NTP hydrolase)